MLGIVVRRRAAANLGRERLGVEKVGEQASVAVADGLLHGLDIASEDGAAGAHGFEQAPRQYKGVEKTLKTAKKRFIYA